MIYPRRKGTNVHFVIGRSSRLRAPKLSHAEEPSKMCTKRQIRWEKSSFSASQERLTLPSWKTRRICSSNRPSISCFSCPRNMNMHWFSHMSVMRPTCEVVCTAWAKQSPTVNASSTSNSTTWKPSWEKSVKLDQLSLSWTAIDCFWRKNPQATLTRHFPRSSQNLKDWQWSTCARPINRCAASTALTPSHSTSPAKWTNRTASWFPLLWSFSQVAVKWRPCCTWMDK